ncbi:MAG: TetR/AcrR family transcriptional regulator [Spirochaetota bacterium]
MGRKSKALERRDEILKHYYQVILEEGYENASIAKIAAHMNTQPSLIMHYFKTKERLVFELITKFMHDFTLQRLEDFYLEANLNKRLDKIIDIIGDTEKFPPEIHKMLYLVKYMSLSNEEIHAELLESMNKYRSMITKIFSELYDHGIILNPDAESITRYFMILIHGLDEVHRMEKDPGETALIVDLVQESFKNKMQINYRSVSGNCRQTRADLQQEIQTERSRKHRKQQ